MSQLLNALLLALIVITTCVNGQAVASKEYLWPNATIPYEISSQYNASEVALIQEGLAEIEKYTCIKFVNRTNQTDYVTYMEYKDPSQSTGGCWAGKWGSTYVGRQGGGQHIISLWRHSGCFKKFDIIHEMMHILGFVHEQQRGDRDDFIYVDIDNVDPAYEEYISNTKNESSGPGQEITFLGTPYDTDSIMHYHPFTYQKDRSRPAMAPKDPCNKIGNEKQLSPIDVLRINKLYNCSATGKPSPPPVSGRPNYDFDHVYSVNCTADARAGRCESDPLYMNAVCGKTCCDKSKGIDICIDKHPKCSDWAQNGECSTSPGYMKSNCVFSCKLC